ncbi:MAG: amino acid adenylation domain-containing protein [Flavobacteriales bacterium]|nr:amino acid adenylation domain-containing protein [Flavobacteriales bacterium]
MNYLLTHSITESAKRFPERQAFVFMNRSLSYKELEQQSNQLANLLIDLGVKKGDRVGIYMNRSLESSIAVYGIMKAGAAYVPLDPDAPIKRTQFLIEDCEIEVLITNSIKKRQVKEIIDAKTQLKSCIGFKDGLTINTIPWEEVLQQSEETPSISILGNDLAYIMYTSGSTGLPKGIMHSHNSGLAYAKLSADLYELTEEDRIGNHAPLHFDISTFGYFTGPFVGATTVIIPDPHTKMPASLAQLIEKEQLSIWYSVPLALVQLLQSKSIEKADMSALRWVLYGGEVFPTKHLNALMQIWPSCQFSNVYGPAEVNQCTYYTVQEPPKEDEMIPLGKVWGNTEKLILNQDDGLAKRGEVGELLIRSATMMKGYWNQSELTKKSLYTLRINSTYKKVFYRTGDLVKLDENNDLLFLGRKDRQIKIRGYRVELDEVVGVLSINTAVHEAAVFAITKEGTVHIAAVIILKEEGLITVEELRDHLNQNLPKYAVPETILIGKQLPRTSNGKINHLELEKTLEIEEE